MTLNLSSQEIDAAQVIWDYHQMGHELVATDLGIGLGSHDLGVADATVDLYMRGFIPKIIFSGANSPTTQTVFPEGEAQAYRSRAIDLGVPEEVIFVDDRATNTGDNIRYSHQVAMAQKLCVRSLTLITKPYMQRRAYSTCKKQWPDVEVVCHSESLDMLTYIRSIGDSKLVVDMLVGDLQRIEVYAEQGFAIQQDVPESAKQAYEYLVRQGYTSRLTQKSTSR